MLVTVEGPNGSGKTTVTRCLSDALAKGQIRCHTTCEPSTSDLGRWVRDLEASLSGRVYACLIAADRLYHIETEIVPSLEEGKVVVSDRYVESSLVLQVADGVDIDYIWGLNSEVLVPDLSVHLLASAECLQRRLARRKEDSSRISGLAGRDGELLLYEEARSFLQRKGFNILLLDNENATPEDNVRRIYGRIEDFSREGSGRGRLLL